MVTVPCDPKVKILGFKMSHVLALCMRGIHWKSSNLTEKYFLDFRNVIFIRENTRKFMHLRKFSRPIHKRIHLDVGNWIHCRDVFFEEVFLS